MNLELNKLLALVALIGFFIGLAVMLWRVDRNDAWRKAHIAQLVVNRHGELDIAAVAFWASFVFSIWALVYCLFKGRVPENWPGLFTTFELTCVAPLITKVIFNRKQPPQPATPDEPK